MVKPPFYAFAGGLAMDNWFAWGACAFLGMLAGANCRRWALAYAGRLDAGAPPDGATLWAALRQVPAHRLCPWRDGMTGVLAGSLAGGLLAARGWAGLAPAILCLVLCALAWIDAHSGLLPDALTLPLMVAGWAVGPLGLTAASSASALVWAGLAAAAGLFRWWRGRDGFGGGDVKCLAALAGWIGLVPALAVLWGASVAGLLWCACVPGAWRRAQPFGPCIALASLPVLLAGPAVQSWF